MFLTEKEIFGQYSALKKTYQYFLKNSAQIRNFFRRHPGKNLCFIGCGSSYFQCRSAEISAKLRHKARTHSIPAGDLLLNFASYQDLLKDSIIIAPTRSGETSEVVLSAKRAKQALGCPILSICCRQNSTLSKIADLTLEIPWAFDQSVCQTRSVTNLYTANLLLIATLARDQKLMAELKRAIWNGEKFQRQNKKVLQEIAQKPWNQVVILADSELEGIANAGALSFKEISFTPSFYYHLLDVRHGPILLIDRETLVIMVCAPDGISYQKDLIKDVKGRNPFLLTLSPHPAKTWASDFHFTIPNYKNYAVWGIPFIFIPQALAFYQALKKGINPDLPTGLAPWIILKEK